ncbi:MAG: lipid II flippase MurJ [Lapillicoccus sp.]
MSGEERDSGGPGAGGGGRAIAVAAGLIAVVTLVARVAGFARWLEFSRSVGATCIGTAYQAANSLPNVLFEVAAGGALAAVAVPLIGGALGRGRSDEADQIGSALLTWTIALLVPAALILVLVAQPVAGWLVDDGACPGGADLAAYMLRLFAPQVALYGVGIVLAGVLQAHRRFLAAALAPLLSSLVVIGAYALYGRLAAGARTIAEVPGSATLALAGGTTLGVVVLSLPLVVPLHRAGIALRPTFRFPPGSAGRVRALAGAGLLALVAQQYAVLATIVVTRRAGPGVLNVYTYVQSVYLLPYAVLAVPLAISTFPALATLEGGAEGRRSRQVQAADLGRPVLARSLRAIVVLGCAGAGVLAAVAAPLGGFFARLDAGRVTSTGREVLAQIPDAVLAFAPGLPAFCVAALLTRALYVRGRPVVAGSAVAAGWLITGSVPLAFVPPGTTPGRALVILGLASSAGMLVAALDLVAATARAWGTDALAGLRRTTVVALVAAGLAALGGWWLTSWWVVSGLGPSALQGCAVGLAALVVVVVVVAFGDREIARVVVSRMPPRRSTPARVSK